MAIKIIDMCYKNIFKNVNLELEEAKVISIQGKNGSGKTILFDLIYGFDINTEGKIIIDGVINKKINENIFYIRQDYSKQLFNINILEDIKYFVPNYEKEKMDELFKYFDLDLSVLKKHCKDLSDGELKKVLLIIMFLSNKKILLIDDITSGLDYKSKKNLIKIIKKEKRNGKLFIISSFDSDFLISVVDKIIYIIDKKVEFNEDKYSFFDNEILLNKCKLNMPKTIQVKNIVFKNKKIKLLYRDNINDLIKDIYRNAR